MISETKMAFEAMAGLLLCAAISFCVSKDSAVDQVANRHVREVLAVLSDELPLGEPWRFEWVDMGDEAWSACSYDGYSFLIELHPALRDAAEVSLTDALLHEWAHARVWWASEAHDARWGAAYARGVRAWWGDP